jgi:hypothetical protein
VSGRRAFRVGKEGNPCREGGQSMSGRRAIRVGKEGNPCQQSSDGPSGAVWCSDGGARSGVWWIVSWIAAVCVLPVGSGRRAPRGKRRRRRAPATWPRKVR